MLSLKAYPWLLLGTEALIMTVGSIDFSFLFFLFKGRFHKFLEGMPVDSGLSIAMLNVQEHAQ